MKSYDEIANVIFKRRDEYIKRQKAKKKKIINTTTTIICCCLVFAVGFGLIENGMFKNIVPIADSSQNSFDNPNVASDDSSDNSNPFSSSDETHSEDEPSYIDSSSELPPYNSDSSQGEFVSDDNPSNTSSDIPPITEPNHFIDSIDKINFYSAKKIINDYSLLPISINSTVPKVVCLSNTYVEYPIDRDKEFTITMVTYFTIMLNDEVGFLAQKLGGTGLVEVVVIQNDIDDLGQMITFKRGNNYYTCLANGESYDTNSNIINREFSSHKYIEGFNMVKNKNQINYKFIVHYEGAKVTGLECLPFGNTSSQYKADDITFIEDFCIVLFSTQNFTIDQLETFFKGKEDSL